MPQHGGIIADCIAGDETSALAQRRATVSTLRSAVFHLVLGPQRCLSARRPPCRDISLVGDPSARCVWIWAPVYRRAQLGWPGTSCRLRWTSFVRGTESVMQKLFGWRAQLLVTNKQLHRAPAKCSAASQYMHSSAHALAGTHGVLCVQPCYLEVVYGAATTPSVNAFCAHAFLRHTLNVGNLPWLK